MSKRSIYITHIHNTIYCIYTHTQVYDDCRYVNDQIRFPICFETFDIVPYIAYIVYDCLMSQ